MKNSSKKNVYESLDILSQEMAKQYFKENINRLSKDIELELEKDQLKKENNEIGSNKGDDENIDILLASFGENKENNNIKKDQDLEPKSNKSSKIIDFKKEINKTKDNIESAKSTNINIEKSPKKIDNLARIPENKNNNNNTNIKNSLKKSFFKKITQANINTNSIGKNTKDDNSSLKTNLINISSSNNNNNESGKKSNVKTISSLFDKRSSDFKSLIQNKFTNYNKNINDKYILMKKIIRIVLKKIKILII